MTPDEFLESPLLRYSSSCIRSMTHDAAQSADKEDIHTAPASKSGIPTAERLGPANDSWSMLGLAGPMLSGELHGVLDVSFSPKHRCTRWQHLRNPGVAQRRAVNHARGPAATIHPRVSVGIELHGESVVLVTPFSWIARGENE